MKIRAVDTIHEFKAHFGLERDGAILETDLDVVRNDCDLHGRKRRDAEVLCTLAANISGSCLDLGTSLGRSAFKLATNLQDRGTVFTVNILPEQHNEASGQLITHLLTKEEIGSFFRGHGLKNVTQIYADTATWTVPTEIRDLAVVFVDAAHDTERVYQDSKKLYDLVRPGSYICWHDFSPECRAKYDWVDAVMRGVERFAAETIPDAEIVHLHHSWMGVLRKPAASAKVRVGLVLERAFHVQNRWTSITTPPLINGILNRFDICWIQNQADYENCLGDVDVLLSVEAGWGAPVLELTRTPALREKLQSMASYMFYSDPHDKKWREDYVLNGLDFVLAFYDAPTRYHFRHLPAERLVHFPWAIPDHWIGRNPLAYRGTLQLTVFGASEHEAYELRNWCRGFPFVESCANSGCENKVMTDEDYLRWLATKDALIAAGSDDPRYRLTTPKYFEIAAIGALLFAQETDDLEGLGFRHRDNCIVFNRSNFETLARDYLHAPGEYLDIRSRGRELIRQRHALSVRLDFLENHMRENIEIKRQSSGGRHATIQPGTGGKSLSKTDVPIRDASQTDTDFEKWFTPVCVSDILAEARREPLNWRGSPLAWEVCHEILAFQRFSGGKYSAEKLIELSNNRYQLMDHIWPGGTPSREQLDEFYVRSAEIVPFGHGVFQADHNVAERRRNWLRRVNMLALLRGLGVDSVLDYGAGGGHTSLLAKAMGFTRVVHHEYPVFHPYALWRAGCIAGNAAGPTPEFIVTDASRPLSLADPAQAILCTDVAEHVFSPDEMLEQIRRALQPGGYLVWVSMFGQGISCHLHGRLAGKEERWLSRHGFTRLGDLPCSYQGYTGLFQATPARSVARKPSAPPALKFSTNTTLKPGLLGNDFVPRVPKAESSAAPSQPAPAREWLTDFLQLSQRPQAPVILDGGTNRGQILDRMLAAMPDATFVAFEPIPALAAELQRKYAAHRKGRVEPVALGACNTRRCFYVNRYDETSSFLPPSKQSADRLIMAPVDRIEVPVLRLDDYCRAHALHLIHFLKLDLQGFELEALKGAEGVLNQVLAVFAEVLFVPLYDRQAEFCELDAFLRSKGFRVFNIYNQGSSSVTGQLLAADVLWVNDRLLPYVAAREPWEKELEDHLSAQAAVQARAEQPARTTEVVGFDSIDDAIERTRYLPCPRCGSAVDRPDLSVNVFCIPALQSPAADAASQGKTFTSPAELYLASADRMDRVLPNLDRLRRELAPAVDTYATVIGGLSGLNYLTALTPKRIIFYDINPVALDYARLMVELIRLTTSPRDFISRVFSRSVTNFLAETGELDLTVANQERYLSRPVEEALLAGTLARLSPEGRKTFQTFVQPHMAGHTLDGVRNCRRLLPCWPENERVPVGGGAALGYDEAGQLVPNTNTFFYGLGWLESPESLAHVQQVLAQATLNFQQFDLLNRDLPELAELSGTFVLHVSNIDDWFPNEFPQLVQQWHEQALAAQCRLTIFSSHNGLNAMSGDPHAWAYGALAPHVFGRVVEVTHKVPWGFHEFARTNVTVQEYLAGDFPADTAILHILLGEGVPRPDFLAVYRKAVAQSHRVIIMEHNRDSADWVPRPPAYFVNEPELRGLLLNNLGDVPARLTKSQKVIGEKDAQRNLVMVLESEAVPAHSVGPVPTDQPAESQIGTVAAMMQRAARASGRSAKPRVLLIADVPNWIFARHCRMLERFLGDRFDFTVQFQDHPVAEERFDLIYPLEWNLIPREQIRTPGKYVTGIRSHISWKDEDFLLFIDFLATHFQRVHVVSRRLQRLFAPFLPDTLLLSHGVDTEFFAPSTAADQSGRGRLRIGWAGNRINATKGFEHYVAPLAQLPGIELRFCGFQDHNLSMDEMRAFYETIDVFVCASSVHHEGNNNSLMEAAAMRRAIVTTDNGAVPEYLHHDENALIVEREVPAFIHAVVQLRDDPALRVRLGNTARESVKNHFEWRDRAEDYRSLFREALSKRDQFYPRSDAGRRAVALPEGIGASTEPAPHALLSIDNRNEEADSACISPHELRAPGPGLNLSGDRLDPKEGDARTSMISSQCECAPRSLKRVGLFGASSRGRQCLMLLAGNDRFLPACFFDNDPGKWGTEFENLPVLQPETSHLESVDVVLVASMRASEIISQLASLGMSRRVALDVPDLFLRFSSPDGEPPPGKHEFAPDLTDEQLVKLIEKDVNSESRSLADRLIKGLTGAVNADRRTDVAACTICSNNYLGMATTLARSYLLHHPGSRFYLCVVGRRASHLTYPDHLDDRIVVIEAERIGIEDFPSMAFGYDALELNCAVKPAFLGWVFANSDCRSVLYLDPDILVMSPIEPIFAGLERATIALTPHLTAPIEDDRSPSELDFLRNGTFNLGCIGIRRGAEAIRFLSWWKRRLRLLGLVDPAHGQFVDQKWLDLAPSLFPDHVIIRDPGCNVAYWNLQERTIAGGSTEFTVNGVPLRFFHFSGFDLLNPNSLSKHQNRHVLPAMGPLRLLFDAYRLLLARAGHFTYHHEPYDYDRFENGVQIPRIARELYRQLGDQRSPGNPFKTDSDDCFFNWLNEPIAPASRVTRLFEAIHRTATAKCDRSWESESEPEIVRRISEAAQFYELDPAFFAGRQADTALIHR